MYRLVAVGLDGSVVIRMQEKLKTMTKMLNPIIYLPLSFIYIAAIELLLLKRRIKKLKMFLLMMMQKFIDHLCSMQFS